MKLRDALYNWLQMAIVVEGRPHDRSAHDTLQFFEEILHEDHHVERVEIADRSEDLIDVRYVTPAGEQTVSFDRQNAEQLLKDIESNPKYNQ
jgi:hypothetical protein